MVKEASRGIWSWNPATGVGPVRFGAEVEDYMDSLGLERKSMDRDGCDEWCEWESEVNEVRLSTCNGIVTGVSCDREFIHQGRNLIGLLEEEAIALLEGTPSISTEPTGCILEYESPPMQLFVSDGRVSIVSVYVDPDSVLPEG